jgi:hypothetical protein
MLTDEQIDFYRRHHYLHAPGVVPSELLELAETILKRWVDETIQSWMDLGLLDDPMSEVDFQHRLVQAWERANRPRYLRSPRRDLVSKEMYDFYRHPALVDLAEDLLGVPEVMAHGTFNARPKLPDQKWTDTPWHQDVQYYVKQYTNPEDVRIEVISLWLPLQRVTEQNSCLQVAPDFYPEQALEAHHDEESGFIGLSKEDAAKIKPISIEMERGDILCFDQFVPHRALPNVSDAVRWSMDIRYESNLTATDHGKKLGFTARSKTHPQLEDGCEQWLEKWKDMPRGKY